MGAKLGLTKMLLATTTCSTWGFTGICAGGVGCMVPKRPLGTPVSSRTLPNNYFTGLPIFGKISGA